MTEEVIDFKSITKKAQKDNTEIIGILKSRERNQIIDRKLKSQSDVNSNVKVKKREEIQKEMKMKVKEESDHS